MDQTDFRKLMQKYGLLNKPIADAYCVLIVRTVRRISRIIFMS